MYSILDFCILEKQIDFDILVSLLVSSKAQAEQVKGIKGLGKVFVSADNKGPEQLAAVISDLQKTHKFDYILGSHSAFGKNVLPRVAALLDTPQVSDVIKIIDGNTFVRPIYAGTP
jgi:electron transfer flavoprotein alpha subunit